MQHNVVIITIGIITIGQNRIVGQVRVFLRRSESTVVSGLHIAHCNHLGDYNIGRV